MGEEDGIKNIQNKYNKKYISRNEYEKSKEPA